MAAAARLIIVSREIGPDDISLIRDRLPSAEDFRTFVVWNYDNEDNDAKWARFEQAALSLKAWLEEEQ